MAIDVIQSSEIIVQLENFVDQIRPDKEEIRRKLDYGYNIDNQSVILYEIRPNWLNPEEIQQHPFAKATYIKRNGIWKIYWMRGNLKWHQYDPFPSVSTFSQFLEIVKSDEHHCFFG